MPETLNEKALQAARDTVKTATAYNQSADISTVSDIAIRAYLSSLPAGDYAELVDGLKAWSDDFTGSYEAGVRTICHKAATAIAALSAERDAFKRMCRENYDAFSAMRNDINELIGNMASQESTLSNGPEMSLECAAVVEAVSGYARRAEAAEDRVKAMDEALEQCERAIAEYYRYQTGGETRGSYDGKPERNGLWSAMYAARRARAVKEGE